WRIRAHSLQLGRAQPHADDRHARGELPGNGGDAADRRGSPRGRRARSGVRDRGGALGRVRGGGGGGGVLSRRSPLPLAGGAGGGPLAQEIHWPTPNPSRKREGDCYWPLTPPASGSGIATGRG